MLTNVFSEGSDACAACFDVARQSGVGGGNVNPRPLRQNRAADFDLPHAKNTVIFQRSVTAAVILD